MKVSDLPVKRYSRKRIAITNQKNINQLEKSLKSDRAEPYIALIKKVYADRNACDIQTISGSTQHNIPVKTRAGLIDDEVYGELDMPAVGDRVLVDFIQGRESLPYIDRTVIPYLNPKYQSNQVPVNTGSKQFTKKLLEEGKENHYRKIFKSGTTLEVEADGTFIIETPSGAFIRINEASSEINIEDMNGNVFKMESGKVTINGNFEVAQ